METQGASQNTVLGTCQSIGLRSCYDEGKRCDRNAVFDSHRQNKVTIKIARILNNMARE